MNPDAAPQVSVTPEDENAARSTAVRTTKLDEAAYARRVRAWHSQAADKEKEPREQEEEDQAFYSGHQWSKEQISARAAAKTPTLTVNYCLPIVNAVVGEERLNRQAINVYGRDTTDDNGGHVFTEIIRWVMYGTNGEYSVSKAFRSSCISGRGWLEVKVNWLDDPEGKIEVREVPRKEIFLDPTSKEEDISDARFLVREKWLTEDEIEAMWPDKAESITLAKALNQNSAGNNVENTYRQDAYKLGDKSWFRQDGTFQILEAWHYEIVPGAVVLNEQTGQLEEMDTDELAKVEQARQLEIQQAEQQNQMAMVMHMASPQMDPMTGAPVMPQLAPVPGPVQAKKRPIKRYFYGFTCGDIVLERGPSPHKFLRRFPYVPVFGMWDEEKECWFGLVRAIKDPQRQHNVEQSAILQWTQTMPKGGWMAPKGGFVDRLRWEQRSSQAGFIGEYNPARGKPEPIRPPTLPRHVIELAPTRLQNMRDISGVNVDLMGNAVKDTPGVVMEMRRKQALTVLQILFDNLRLSRRILGEVLIAFIQQYIADGRRLRIVGQPNAGYVMATADLQFGKYDAIVEDSPESPNDKMATMYILQTTLPMLMKAGIPIPPSFVDLLPISPHIRDEWKALIQSMMGGPVGGPPPTGAPNGAPPPEAGPPQG
jgi:hypothetical protein